MRNGYIINSLTSNDIQEIIRFGWKLIEIYEAVIYRENFKVNLFKKVSGNLLVLKIFIKKWWSYGTTR